MIRNWYTLSIDELTQRKDKLLDWCMDNPNHKKTKKSWQAVTEIAEVIEVKKQAQDDEFMQLVIDTLCT